MTLKRLLMMLNRLPLTYKSKRMMQQLRLEPNRGRLTLISPNNNSWITITISKELNSEIRKLWIKWRYNVKRESMDIQIHPKTPSNHICLMDLTVYQDRMEVVLARRVVQEGVQAHQEDQEAQVIRLQITMVSLMFLITGVEALVQVVATLTST